MNVIGFSKHDKQQDFEFTNEKTNENLHILHEKYSFIKEVTLQLKKKGVLYRYENEDSIYYFLITETTNVKDAIYISKNFLYVIRAAIIYREKENSEYDKSSEAILHNTKNIQNQSFSKLKTLLHEDQLMYQDNKIQYIKDEIEKNSIDVARTLLSLLKDFSQINFEYSVQEYLKPGVNLTGIDFSNYPIHTLFVTAYYVFESEFKQRNIKIELEKSQIEVNVHFSTFKSALVQLFDNALKYCKDNSTIEVTYTKRDSKIIIDIAMDSIYVKDDNFEQIFKPNFRSDEAKKIGEGKGLGLSLAKKMLELNNSTIFFRRLSEPIRFGKIKFCRNMFVIHYQL